MAGNALETPIDIKMYLFNKRMHTWYHHEHTYQQYMDLQVRELLPAPQTHRCLVKTKYVRFTFEA